MSDPTGNVVNLDQAVTPSLEIILGKVCSHGRLHVNEYQRCITCRDCGAQVDAFSVVMDYARSERRFAFENDHARKRTTQLQESIADLERRERNARARVKRHEGKALECMTLDEAMSIVRLNSVIRSLSDAAIVPDAIRKESWEQLEPIVDGGVVTTVHANPSLMHVVSVLDTVRRLAGDADLGIGRVVEAALKVVERGKEGWD